MKPTMLKGVVNLIRLAIDRIKQPATQTTAKAIEAAGGRKFFYGGWLIPVWILATFLLHMPDVLILAGAGGIGFAIGWEGARDLRAVGHAEAEIQDEAG